MGTSEHLSLAKRLTTMEMKELNERQRAEHAVRIQDQLRKTLSEMENRNMELEHKFAQVKEILGDCPFKNKNQVYILTSLHQRPYKHAILFGTADRRASKRTFRFLCVLAEALSTRQNTLKSECPFRHCTIGRSKMACLYGLPMQTG